MFCKISVLSCILLLLAGCHTGEKQFKKIICFGDSLTSCGGEGGRYSDMLQLSLPGYIVINSGKSGDTIAGALARLETDVLAYKGDYLVICIGANDYWQRNRSLRELKDDYNTILARCHAAGMKTVIVSCFGNEASSGNMEVDIDTPGLSHEYYAAGIGAFECELAALYRAEYVPDMQCGILPKGREDFWSDSNHPNASGNRIVADTILPALEKIMNMD